jgi:hypothetical protein
MVKGKGMIGIGVLLVGIFCLAGMSYADAPVWEPDVRLTYDSSGSWGPAITSDANGLHVVWMDYRDGNQEIYYKHSPDFGNTWDADVRLTNDSSDSFWPAITSDENGLHVVWMDYRDGNWEIYYKHSPDFGNTWDADVRLTYDSSFAWRPAITSDANGLHVVWYDLRDGNLEIYYKHSPDFGNTWEADVRLTYDSSDSFWPAITSDANGLHVVWYDLRDGNAEIYYKHSPDFGNTWDADVRLTYDSSDSQYPAITSDANGLHVVWMDERDGNEEIYYKHSPDFGNTWDADVRLTYDSSVSYWPAITSDENGLHVVWEDYRDGNEEIYYKHSPDFGNTWDADVRLTNDSSVSEFPAITSDENGLHVVWFDDRDGNNEIYYKRGTFPPQELTIDIILNDDSFEPGETITIDVQVDNPCDCTIMTDVRICVKLPDDSYYRIIKLNDFPIPLGTLGPINLVNYTFTTNNSEGTYEAIGRLLHPDSGETLTEDIEPFKFANP